MPAHPASARKRNRWPPKPPKRETRAARRGGVLLFSPNLAFNFGELLQGFSKPLFDHLDVGRLSGPTHPPHFIGVDGMMTKVIFFVLERPTVKTFGRTFLLGEKLRIKIPIG